MNVSELSLLANEFDRLTPPEGPKQAPETQIYLRVQGDKLTIEPAGRLKRMFSKGFNFSDCANRLEELCKGAQILPNEKPKVEKFLSWCQEKANKRAASTLWRRFLDFFRISPMSERSQTADKVRGLLSQITATSQPEAKDTPRPLLSAPKQKTAAPAPKARPAAPASKSAEWDRIAFIRRALEKRTDELSKTILNSLPSLTSGLIEKGRSTIFEKVLKNGNRPTLKVKLAQKGDKVQLIAREYLAEGVNAFLFRRSVLTERGWSSEAYRKIQKDQTLGEKERAKKKTNDSLEISKRVGDSEYVIAMRKVSKGEGRSVGSKALVEEGETKGLLMPLYKGDVSSLIKEEGLSSADKKDIALQMALGVQAFHKAEVIHLDIKPANFLYRMEGKTRRVALADFDLSKKVGEPIDKFRGSEYFASPEIQGLTKKSAVPIVPTPAADIYSLGLTLYEVFHEPAAAATGIKNVNPKNVRMGVQEKLKSSQSPVDKLIARMLNADPQTRPTIDEVVAILRKNPAPAAFVEME